MGFFFKALIGIIIPKIIAWRELSWFLETCLFHLMKFHSYIECVWNLFLHVLCGVFVRLPYMFLHVNHVFGSEKTWETSEFLSFSKSLNDYALSVTGYHPWKFFKSAFNRLCILCNRLPPREIAQMQVRYKIKNNSYAWLDTNILHVHSIKLYQKYHFYILVLKISLQRNYRISA